MTRLLSYLSPYRWPLVMVLICILVSTVATVAGSKSLEYVVDDYIRPLLDMEEADFGPLFRFLCGMAAIFAAGIVSAFFYNYLMVKVAQGVQRDIRDKLFSNMQQLPIRYFDTHTHGDIMSRYTNDIDTLRQMISQAIPQCIASVVTIVTVFVTMLVSSLTLTAVAVVALLAILVATKKLTGISGRFFVGQQDALGEVNGYIEEMVGSQKVVKAFCYEDRAQDEFNEINRQLYLAGVKSQFYSSLTNPCTRFVNGVVYAAVAIFGALSCIAGSFSVGALSSFLAYANQYTKPFNDEPAEQPDAPDAAQPQQSQGNVEIDHVSFSYDKNHPLIRDFNLTVKPGQRIALVGPTGCGKTTMINLLMRFYDVDEGEIRVDGTPVKQIGRGALRSLYGMVLQDTWMFKGSVRDNIAYGKPDATEEEIITAAKAAHAHSFIKRLPQGYDTILSEDGGNISQGQKQLLCIARAMLTKPSMLILDEATSNIDTRTELKIQKAFAEMMKGHTSFVVAHRLSTIREADCILVMKDGQIIEQGTHKELLQKQGFYHQLYYSQFVQTEE